MNQQSSYTLAELNRRFAALVIFGVVVEVDSTKKLLKVQEGSLKSGWLPWPAETGRNYSRWCPVKKGQQFVVLCRSGDPSQGVIVGELYSESNNSPSTDENTDLIQYASGATISYNASTNVLEYAGFADVIVNGVSVPHHKHTDVMPGSAKTGEPE